MVLARPVSPGDSLGVLGIDYPAAKWKSIGCLPPPSSLPFLDTVAPRWYKGSGIETLKRIAHARPLVGHHVKPCGFEDGDGAVDLTPGT
jgi:hypothetical protein